MTTPSTTKQIYVYDLPFTVNKKFLRSLFSDESEPIEIILMKHRTKCDAIITYESHEVAKNVIYNLTYTKLDGIPIHICWADPETMRILQSGPGTLLIEGLEESIEACQLHEAFANFGDVIDCHIPLRNGKSCGYGYIQFRNPADAERAKSDLADASINGKKIHIKDYVRPQRRNSEDIFPDPF